MIALDHLKLLVNLARIDGDLAEQEKQYIITIGQAHGFPASSVSTLFYHSHEVVITTNLTEEEKFKYIVSLVQLMKIDNQVYPKEIAFCSEIALKLGYSTEIIDELLLFLKNSDGSIDQPAWQAWRKDRFEK